MLLDLDTGRAQEIVMGLRLLTEEPYLPKNLCAQLSELDRCRAMAKQGDMSEDDFVERVSRFLSDYATYADDVRRLEPCAPQKAHR